MRRMAVPAAVVALATAACGGGASVFTVSSEAAGGPVRLSAEAIEVAGAVADSLGPEPGLLAVGYALDRGYTSAQIASGAQAGQLSAGGVIAGVDPALPPWGIFAALPTRSAAPSRDGEAAAAGSGGAARAALHSPGSITGEELLRQAALEFGLATGESGGTISVERPGGRAEDLPWAVFMTGLIVDLAEVGYTAEQILLGIVLTEVRLETMPSGIGPVGCWLLREAGGRLIPPDGPRLGAFTSSLHCRNALDRLVAEQAGATSSTSTTDATTSTASACPDDDADWRGLGFWGEFDPSLLEEGLRSPATNSITLIPLEGGAAELRFNVSYEIPGATEGPNQCPSQRGWYVEPEGIAVARCGAEFFGEFTATSYLGDRLPANACPAPGTFERRVACRLAAAADPYRTRIEGVVTCDDLEIRFTVRR